MTEHQIPHKIVNAKTTRLTLKFTRDGYLAIRKPSLMPINKVEQFVEMQSAVYAGEAIPFKTTKSYTNAKVMVWDGLTTLRPVCKVEIIK